MRIILASASPRRRDILNELGLKFEIIPADIDESKINENMPSDMVEKLSNAKAQKVYENNKDAVIIAADTIVYLDNKYYGKPYNEMGAIKMIEELNDKWHSVYSGVTVIKDGMPTTFGCESKVKFKKLSLEEIENYVKVCKPFDKAGAYGIQDNQIVESYKGSYSNIVGLPKEELEQVLIELGVIND